MHDEEILTLYAKALDGVRQAGISLGCFGTKLSEKVGVVAPNIVDLTTDEGTFELIAAP